MKILAIVHTLSAWHKTNGYSSHYSTVHNTDNGKSVSIADAGGRSNIAGIVRQMVGEGVFTVESDRAVRDMPKKRDDNFYENADGLRALAALFNFKMCEACQGEGQTYNGEHKLCDVCNRVGFIKPRRPRLGASQDLLAAAREAKKLEG